MTRPLACAWGWEHMPIGNTSESTSMGSTLLFCSTMSLFAWAPATIHVPETVSQMSHFLICCLFLPSWMIWSMAQQRVSSVGCPKDSSHSPLLVWILLAPCLLGATGTRRSASCGLAGAFWPCSTKDTWWLPVLTYRLWSIQQVWDGRRVWCFNTRFTYLKIFDIMLDFDLEEWYSIMLKSQHRRDTNDCNIQWNHNTNWFPMPVSMCSTVTKREVLS